MIQTSSIHIKSFYKTKRNIFVLIFKTKELQDSYKGFVIEGKYKDDNFSITLFGKIPSKNSKAYISESNNLITMHLPDTMSNRQVHDAFSKIGKILELFYGRHKVNPNIRNGRRHTRLIPKEHDFSNIPRRIAFNDRIVRNIMYPEKVISCEKCKKQHLYVTGCILTTEYKNYIKLTVPEQQTVQTPNPTNPPSTEEVSIDGEISSDEDKAPEEYKRP